MSWTPAELSTHQDHVVAHVIDAEGNVVAGERHLARGVGVGPVGVIEDWRREERGEEDDEPERDEEQHRRRGSVFVRRT